MTVQQYCVEPWDIEYLYARHTLTSATFLTMLGLTVGRICNPMDSLVSQSRN